MSEEAIRPGTYVIVHKRGFYRVSRLEKNTELNVVKLKFYPDAAFGMPYGTMFEVGTGGQLTTLNFRCNEGGDLLQMSNKPESTKADEVSSSADCPSSCQRLSQNDVISIKADGVKSEELLSRLMENSTTFQKKSVYAKEKWVVRKERKHTERITFLKPTPRLLCQVYYSKNPERISGLRLDILALILGISNVQCSSKVLLMDNCMGLVMGAVIERLANTGMCLLLHSGDQPQSNPGFDMMNFSEEQDLACFYPLPLQRVFSCAGSQTSECIPPSTIDFVTPSLKQTARMEKTRQKEEKVQRALSVFHNGELDTLILAAPKYQPVLLLKHFLNKLCPSRRFVVYSPFLEPLVECFQWCKESDLCVKVTLLDSFYRSYQVLPDRTHPEMSQNVSGGFILHGITVEP